MSQEDRVKIIERCLDDGGRQIDGLNGFATSADQRAITIASVYIGTATALVAGLLALSSESGDLSKSLTLAGAAAALLFYVGAFLCLWTAFPQVTFISGNPPKFWQFHIENKSTYEAALETQIAEYETKIANNSAKRRASARIFKWGALIGASAPIVGLIIFWAV